MDNEFFTAAGMMALGSRLRLLTAKITADAKKIYGLYAVELEPKWFPVFYMLSMNDEKTVTEIATGIGHSQPSVSKIIREMAANGLVLEKRATADGRRNVVRLSKKGIGVSKKILDQYTDVTRAVERITAQTENDLWKAMVEWEFLLKQKSLLQRVKEIRKERESEPVKIVPYQPRYRAAFAALNEEWITRYFKMEEADHKALSNPGSSILKKGGYIFVALYHNEPVGVCALLKMNDPLYQYELAKMAVSPAVQGKNIGWLLGQAVVDKAKDLGASALYLESNTILQPAINLYHKLGFQKTTGHPSPYERCNIQMVLHLK